MTDDRGKTPRTLLVADHLWEAFQTMAVEMGSERDVLINQALYTFARLNGFLVPADLKSLGTILPQSALTDSGRLRIAQPPPPPPDVSGSGPRPAANPERMAEIAQRLTGSAPRSMGAAAPALSPPPPVARNDPSPVEVDDSLLGEEGATSMDLPNIASALGGIKQPASPAAMVASHPSDPGTVTPGGRTLVLLADGRELDRVIKDRFLIGRGKHCDLIINSGKVSREHAAITREGSVWFIEDLGSSNGTWFDKRRISRRQIQDGDEYYICSEKLACTFR
jgi:hypothetical protein